MKQPPPYSQQVPLASTGAFGLGLLLFLRLSNCSQNFDLAVVLSLPSIDYIIFSEPIGPTIAPHPAFH